MTDETVLIENVPDVRDTNALLQAMGKVNVPVVTMLTGGAVKLLVNYTLVGTPSINIHGAPIGTLCCYATIT
ncbi:MAG: polysaccharide biosynthesis C-terminal domain-containing protein, partial [Lachnospiraceae bacterium]|nr:polysaccharide biosynthesis C-terminal domain-containing protein [Lachnospiraceae bacterium]